MVGKNLPGTYETGTQGMTTRAQELLDEYKNSKKEGIYGLTTAESQEIREAIKTAGDVRKLLMREESVADYNQLSPKSKEILKKAYSEASEKIKQIASKKIEDINEGYKNGKIEWMSALDAEKKLGEKLAGIIEVAKNDFGVPSTEIEKYGGGSTSLNTIEPPLMQTRYVNIEDHERRLKEEFNESYRSKWSKIESELREKAKMREKKRLTGLKKDVEAEASANEETK